MAGGRAVETSPLLSTENCITLNKNTHSMYVWRWLRCCDSQSFRRCDSCTEPESGVGSGDKGLGLLCFDLLSAETDFWWLEDEQ